ncbi:cation diffusion facilitator family transporter, partial [Chloroflexota bacterium]
ANARNIAADVYSASGVLAGLIAIRFTGLYILDPIIALAVASLVLKVGYDVLRKSFHGLIDVKLPEGEENEIKTCIMEQGSNLVGFHNLRTRKSGSQRYIDLHLVVPKDSSVEEAHQTCNLLEKNLRSRLHDASITIHVEPCDNDCEQCSLSCTMRKGKD